MMSVTKLEIEYRDLDYNIVTIIAGEIEITGG